ncbi:MAG: CehA/McbA family metallohydrolase [Pseudomonadota bacterium]
MTVARPSTFSAPGRFWQGNTHTHSDLSDGALPLGEVCARYRAEGYDFLSMTEHLVGLYDYPIADTVPFRTDDFTTILGAEVHTSALGNGEIWHLVAVGLPSDFERPEAPHFGGDAAPESAASLARRCRDAGAFVSIAHPQWYNLTLEDARQIEAAHAVEIYNHGCEVECARGDGAAIWDLLLTDGKRLSGCATDDAHFKGPDHFGGWVMVKAEANDPDLLLEALKVGRYYSSQGPRLHDVRIEGNRLHVDCSPADRIIALGSRATAKQAYGKGITSADFSLAAFKPGGWVRVVVADRFDCKAWSNPIWLDDPEA